MSTPIEIYLQIRIPVQDAAFDLLKYLGFNPESNNNNIHIKVREKDFNIDFWPTTNKCFIQHKKEGKQYKFTDTREGFVQGFKDLADYYDIYPK